MRVRAVLLADGPSDVPLGDHVKALAVQHGMQVDVVAPEFDRMEPPPGRRVADRLARVLKIDNDFDLVIAHRDAEREGSEVRRREICAGLTEAGVELPHVPVVPVRMTEAWLLLDESAIRAVAGRPTATNELRLPSVGEVEQLADPKETLQEALCMASGLQGRRLRKLKRDFGHHRRQLMERIDRTGPVQQLASWRELETAVQAAAERLADGLRGV